MQASGPRFATQHWFLISDAGAGLKAKMASRLAKVVAKKYRFLESYTFSSPPLSLFASVRTYLKSPFRRRRVRLRQTLLRVTRLPGEEVGHEFGAEAALGFWARAHEVVSVANAGVGLRGAEGAAGRLLRQGRARRGEVRPVVARRGAVLQREREREPLTLARRKRRRLSQTTAGRRERFAF